MLHISWLLYLIQYFIEIRYLEIIINLKLTSNANIKNLKAKNTRRLKVIKLWVVSKSKISIEELWHIYVRCIYTSCYTSSIFDIFKFDK